MTDALLALTTMTASAEEDCGCSDTLSTDTGTPGQAHGANNASAFWEGVLGMEGELTGDGRFIEPNALKWEVPMPLRYVRSDVGEHGGAVVAGRILAVERRPGGVIYGFGDYDMGGPDGIEAERLVREKVVNGVSMDLDDVAFEVRVAAELVNQDPAQAAPMVMNEDGSVTLMKINPSDEIRATQSARMRAATIVSIPAFASAQIFSATNPPAVAQAAISPSAQTLEAETEEAPTGHDENGDCITDPEDPNYVEDCVPADQKVASPGKPGAMTAAAFPVSPPQEWFSDPKFRQATALTVTKEGRIFGHLAAWGVCHIGMSHQGCVTAPKSRSGYAYFHTGSIVTAENSEIPVGHITLDTTHAPTQGLSATGAQNHYEVTGHVVADVAVGEDRHGIWVSGALRPNVSDAKLRELRSAPLSGDWRRVAGNLELVAALAVNVPGFPVPRPKGMVAGGVVQSLVASGMVPPKQVKRPGTEGALSDDDLRYLKRLADRERQEEQSLLAGAAIDTATALAQRVRASTLAMRVHRT